MEVSLPRSFSIAYCCITTISRRTGQKLAYSTVFTAVSDFLEKKYITTAQSQRSIIDHDEDLPFLAAHLSEDLLNLPNIRTKFIWLISEMLMDYLYEKRDIESSDNPWFTQREAVKALSHSYSSDLMVELEDLLTSSLTEVASMDIQRAEAEFNRYIAA